MEWKKISNKQWCKKFDGEGSTPSFKVSNIPPSTVALIVEFNDETYQPMNFGGHGILRFTIPDSRRSDILPSIPGEQDSLPPGVTLVKAHLSSEWSGTKGAYLPPCSGGKGNLYTATIKAVDKSSKILAKSRFVLGHY